MAHVTILDEDSREDYRTGYGTTAQDATANLIKDLRVEGVRIA